MLIFAVRVFMEVLVHVVVIAAGAGTVRFVNAAIVVVVLVSRKALPKPVERVGEQRTLIRYIIKL